MKIFADGALLHFDYDKSPFLLILIYESWPCWINSQPMCVKEPVDIQINIRFRVDGVPVFERRDFPVWS